MLQSATVEGNSFSVDVVIAGDPRFAYVGARHASRRHDIAVVVS